METNGGSKNQVEFYLLRTMLFVPGNSSRMIDKSRGLDADAVILDLEDAVPSSEKEVARRIVRKELKAGMPEHLRAFVRVNSPRSGHMEADLESVVCERLDGICIPKCEGAGDVDLIDELLAACEAKAGLAKGSVKLIPFVETAKGLMEAYRLAQSSSRVIALAFGAEDFCSDTGTLPSADSMELLYARSNIIVSAKAAGLQAIDTIYAYINDIEGLIKEAKSAKRLGFNGKLAIHPKQIEPINQAFTPTQDELSEARRILQAYQAAESRGSGIAVLDGKMIDRPMVLRAQRTMIMAEAIRKRYLAARN